MQAVNIDVLGKSVLWCTFAITFVLGAVMQKTGFCSMGAVSDAFIMSSWDRMRQWFLAIGVAIIEMVYLRFALIGMDWVVMHRKVFLGLDG